MIDTARAERVLIEKHDRGTAMVISVEEYERLFGCARARPAHSGKAVPRRIGKRARTGRS
jgi:hypothetical protein